MGERLFDQWPDKYDRWFHTPVGRLVKRYEQELIMELLQPRTGERILDAGCGTGIFTTGILTHGTLTVGLDISAPMLQRAITNTAGLLFFPCLGDLSDLPFQGGIFDKAVSVTALEFVADAPRVITELFRVTKKGGVIVVATLNCDSPWATRRTAKIRRGEQSIFSHTIFRSPEQLLQCAPFEGIVKTAIHFDVGDDPQEADRAEQRGRLGDDRTGAFVAARWVKP